MTTQAIIEKIEKIGQEMQQLKQPKSILGKVFVDSTVVKKAKKAIFDFDIEKFVTKRDLN